VLEGLAEVVAGEVRADGLAAQPPAEGVERVIHAGAQVLKREAEGAEQDLARERFLLGGRGRGAEGLAKLGGRLLDGGADAGLVAEEVHEVDGCHLLGEHDLVGAGAAELRDGGGGVGAGGDAKAWVEIVGAEGDEDVVGVGGEGDDEAGGALDAGAAEGVLVVGVAQDGGKGLLEEAIAQVLVVEALAKLLARGEDAPIYVSANLPGGKEHNEAVLARYRGRIRFL